MARRRQRQRLPQGEFEAVIESLSSEGRGVCHLDGKATFIDGALPGEKVAFTYVSQHRKYDEGVAVRILHASPDRVEPKCAHAEICGGCSLQHLSSTAQIMSKQNILIEQFRHLARLEIETLLPPLMATYWGYRRKARLGVRYVTKKQRVLVGFREKRSGFLADLSQCEVLHPSVGQRLEVLQSLIAGLEAFQDIPQIEVACGDTQTALIFRHLQPLSDKDRQKLIAFARDHEFHVYLQPAGPESVSLLWPEGEALEYRLNDYELSLQFLPNDFVQVNAQLNQKMIAQAISLLDIQADDHVLDLFCGLGNFSLPLATRAASVVGIEGDQSLVDRAAANAQRNHLDNLTFYAGDLCESAQAFLQGRKRFSKILLDPPRSGALEVVQRIAELNAQRILYVSCNIATLARDAAELVQRQGYRLVTAGVMDMFPQTTHVESMALFEKI